MQLYNRKRWWKFMLFLGAAAISVFTLLYTNRLTSELKLEEQKKMELWAEANRLLTIDATPGETMALILEILRNNTTVPVILTEDDDNIVFHRNVKLSGRNDEIQLAKALQKMKKYRQPIPVKISDDEWQYIYYYDSILLRKLQWFPIVQLLVVFVFMLIAYVAFSVARKWEQDQVWVGMARETAHQLGTPTTSLLGWLDVLGMKNADPQLLDEMRFDIQRLQTITSRFSKIGSRPELYPEDVAQVVQGMADYLKKRSSSFVVFNLYFETLPVSHIPLSRSLFEWVVENICKNAIDAMEGEGQITIRVFAQKNDEIVLDISDTGKGMSKSIQKTVFKPGYSTKARGWGLGLTLSRRIVEQYHGGRIFILASAPGKGTTFRIVLPSKKK